MMKTHKCVSWAQLAKQRNLRKDLKTHRDSKLLKVVNQRSLKGDLEAYRDSKLVKNYLSLNNQNNPNSTNPTQ